MRVCTGLRVRTKVAIAALTMLGLTALPTSAAGTPSGSAATVSASGAAAMPPVVSEWTVESPWAHHMDPAVLEGARSYAFVPARNTQGVVVVRHGAIVAEWYAEGTDAHSWATSWSMSKSFTSALVGIAIDEGLIPSVDEPMTTYFPEWAGTPREATTLRDVLRMRSGLAWSESYAIADLATSNVIQMVAGQGDQLAYAASRPQQGAPGVAFNYSSGDSMLLSGVLEAATGRSADQYAREKIFEPIGMDQAELWTDAVGHGLTYCCVDTTSRGFARFGQLYLQGGRWGDQQVVPADWVAASTDPSLTSSTYGYQWWLSDVAGAPTDLYMARGHDGQYIYVVPSLDLVVVRNGTYHKADVPPVADPSLAAHMPPQGLVPGKGTIGPSSWNHTSFLAPILASIDDAPEGPFTTTFPAEVCTNLDAVAAASGSTRAEVLRSGVRLLDGLAAAGGAVPLPPNATVGGPCEVPVDWTANDLGAVHRASAAWSVSPSDLHHVAGRLVLVLVWWLHVNRGG